MSTQEQTLFTHVRLVTPERVREDRAVLVRGGRIAGVYPAQAAPAGGAQAEGLPARYV